MKSLFERFMLKCSPCPITGCWWWTGSVDCNGYGKIGAGGRRGRTLIASRVAYELFKGPLKNDACRSCDNGALGCVNPDHIFDGSRSDNVRDCVRKGRFLSWKAQGRLNPNAKLTAKDVSEIRKLAASGVRQVDIASRFGIDQTRVSTVIRSHWTGGYELS